MSMRLAAILLLICLCPLSAWAVAPCCEPSPSCCDDEPPCPTGPDGQCRITAASRTPATVPFGGPAIGLAVEAASTVEIEPSVTTFVPATFADDLEANRFVLLRIRRH